MRIKKILFGMVVSVLIFPGAVAMAHEHDRTAALFFYLSKPSVDIPGMIEKAEQEDNGNAVSFRIRDKDDVWQLKIKMMKNGKILEVKADPETGKILSTEKEGFFSDSDFSDDLKTNDLKNKISLTDAIRKVEKQYEGKVLNGRLRDENGMVMYRLEIATSEGVFGVMMDADGGKTFRASGLNGRYHHERDDDDE